MHMYVVEYLNENEFNKKIRALKKYNMLAYKKLIFDCVPKLRDGSLQGVAVSKNSKEGIMKYEYKLPTDRMCSQVHGDIVLHYTIYENQKLIMLERKQIIFRIYKNEEKQINVNHLNIGQNNNVIIYLAFHHQQF